MTNLPDLTQEPIRFVDATPNQEYPLRILKAYRLSCDCRWADSSDPNAIVTNPLLVEMNKHNDQRAEILDAAIRLLETQLKPKPEVWGPDYSTSDGEKTQRLF